MKTITAKEFQLKHAAVLKEVAAGHEYEVTFHRKPLVKLLPAAAKSTKALRPGSHQAFLESLRYTVQSTGELHDLSYDELRGRMMADKHGG